MPAPQQAQMHELVRTKFVSFKLKIPPDWKEPLAGSQFEAHYKGFAFKSGEGITTPGIPGLPDLFGAGSLNKYHTDAQKFFISKVDDFMKHTTDHICKAWSQWHQTAVLTNVVVNGPVASGGVLTAPPLMTFLMAGMPAHAMMAKYYTSVCTAISTAWQQFIATVKVPALPWYPAFAAFPGPMAPPTPNIPMPFANLTQVPTMLQASTLANNVVKLLAHKEEQYKEMIEKKIKDTQSKVQSLMPSIPAIHTKWLDTPKLSTGPFAGELFESITHGFEQCYNQWKISTIVNQVMAQGPVPTFAPPVVPAGPVVGGIANMIPGGFK